MTTTKEALEPCRDDKQHPLGIEMLVNCTECGHILKAELCNHDERPFSKQVLITVERCKCENVSKS